jgi:hypothetical protein
VDLEVLAVDLRVAGEMEVGGESGADDADADAFGHVRIPR